MYNNHSALLSARLGRRTVGVFLALLATPLATLSMTALPAAADTPNCVSRAEYRKVHQGMAKERVHRIFDVRGRFADGGAGGYARVYRGCWKATGVFVEYNAMQIPHRAARKSFVPLYFEGDCPNGVCG